MKTLPRPSSGKAFSLRWLAAATLIFLLAACQPPSPQGKEKAAGESESQPTPQAEATVPTPQPLPAPEPVPVPQAGPPDGTNLATAIIAVAKATLPAVVHIEVVERQEVANPFYGLGANPFFRQFGIPKMPKTLKRELRALGTGMILDTEGHVLTNAHVVAGATEIKVTLASGDEFTGKVVGEDPQTDLAVVQVPGRADLPVVTLGDSDSVQVGQWVVAIGHPRGLDQTVTHGIISAKHRQGITDPMNYQDFLQTDAAINPGNSGGPLLDLSARVIGVNSMIASVSGGSEGIGFAIPSNMVRHVAQQIIEQGKVVRGWLGLSAQELTPALSKAMGLDTTQGALVADVVKGSPAEKAGLKRGDVITAFNGKEISTAADLRNRSAATAPGQEATLSVLRKGKTLDLTVKVGDLDAATRLLAESVKGRLGVSVRDVTPEETARYGLDSDVGAVVASLDPKGPLASVGFEVDDLLLEINGEPVRGEQGFVELAESLRPGQKVAVLGLDHRTGNTGYVQVTVR